MFVLDADDGRILDTLALDPRPGEMDEPHGLAVAPDGRFWYATVSHGQPTLWKFEADGDRLVGRLRLGIPGAGRIGITPDGRRAFVPDYWRTGQGRVSEVAVVALDDLTEEAVVSVCPAPHDAVVDPSGRRVAIACSLGDEVVVLDVVSLAPVARFPVGPEPGPAGEPRYRPINLVWSADGGRLFVALAMAGRVAVFDAEGAPLGTVEVGAMPTQLARGPGDAVVVVSRHGGSLSVIDTGSLTETKRIALEGVALPHGIALDPGGRRAFVSYEGAVDGPGGAVAVDLAAGTVLWRTEAGSYVLGIAYRGG